LQVKDVDVNSLESNCKRKKQKTQNLIVLVVNHRQLF